MTAPAVNKWEKGTTCPEVQLLPALLFEMEHGPQYEFLQEEEELKRVIEFYRARC